MRSLPEGVFWKNTLTMMGGSWAYLPDTADLVVCNETTDGKMAYVFKSYPDGRTETFYHALPDNDTKYKTLEEAFEAAYGDDDAN